MTLGLGQILFVVFICFILFGDLSNLFKNLTIGFTKLKQFLDNNK